MSGEGHLIGQPIIFMISVSMIDLNQILVPEKSVHTICIFPAAFGAVELLFSTHHRVIFQPLAPLAAGRHHMGLRFLPPWHRGR